ncbi:MAG: DUF362 domain-containing protein [Oscillospiraceae bacterium]|nr:DUF362 domain-containing protein [Oscillospiraceae bacterium]
MAKVLFSSVAYAQYDYKATLPSKFERLLDSTGLETVVKDKVTAVKMHVGRGIGFTTIHPLFVKILVDRLKAWGARVYITDQAVAGARVRGYTEELLGCPIVDVAGIVGKYFYPKDVDYKTLRNVDVAGHIHDADVMIDLSHVKGHGSCGYGGACKNIAMGCVTDRTRAQIHGLEGGLKWDAEKCVHCELCIRGCNHDANSFDADGNYHINYHHCTYCAHCAKVCPTGAITMVGDRYEDFQTGMALCTKTVLDTFAPGSVYYINFLTDITALCDCWGMSTPALVPDIGIAASPDIVAIERACLDMIDYRKLDMNAIPKGYQLGAEGHLFQRLHAKDPFIQINKLEGYGLGSQRYDLEEVG